jgi:hypothetical protein
MNAGAFGMPWRRARRTTIDSENWEDQMSKKQDETVEQPKDKPTEKKSEKSGGKKSNKKVSKKGKK